MNALRPPYVLIPGQTVKLPQPLFHVVSENDNLYAISRSYGVDISRLAQKNNLKSPYNLTAGQKLFLPSTTELALGSSTNTARNNYDFSTSSSASNSNKVTSEELTPINASTTVKASQAKSDKDDDESPFAYQQETTTPTMAVLKAKEKEKPQAAISAQKDVTAQTGTTSLQKAGETKQGGPKELFAEDTADEPAQAPLVKSKSSGNKQVEAVKSAGTTEEESPFITQEKTAPKTTAKQEIPIKSSFSWPVSGNIISRFGPKKGGLYNDGINISAKDGAPIKASEAGEVVYSGNELRGYGNMLLIKHNNGYLTAYAHAGDVLVKKGDIVKKGQLVGRVGQTGHVSSPQLHFSIRQGRKAIDPEKYLPTT